MSRLRKALIGLAAILLFVLALELIKAGAKDVGTLVRDVLRVTNEANALGFGWILAGVVLSGSPVAALGLALLAGGAVTSLQAFLMITGSRLGASLVVLGIAYVHHLRGRHEASTSLEVGVLAVLVTFCIYLPATILGWILLATDALGAIRLGAPRTFVGAIDSVYGPIVALADRSLPWYGIAAAGVVLLVVSLNVFDRALPDLQFVSRRGKEFAGRVFRPGVTFVIGMLVTTFTLSVSVSLGLLVPLAAKGYARRENVVPYIMGANITTFIDTLFASLLVNHPDAFTVVLAEVASVAAVSALVLLALYQRFERILFDVTDRIVERPALLAVLVGALVTVPFLLLLV